MYDIYIYIYYIFILYICIYIYTGYRKNKNYIDKYGNILKSMKIYMETYELFCKPTTHAKDIILLYSFLGFPSVPVVSRANVSIR